MATKRRCFATTKALRRLHPGLLADVLRKFPDYLKECRIRLPKEPDLSSMPYEAIQKACMGGTIPQELDDVLFFVCILGTSAGWTRIQEEARFQGRNLKYSVDGYTTADLAMKAWLHDWPNNRQLLEQSHARAKIHARSSYVYYAPTRDVRDRYQAPTRRAMNDLREQLADYFVHEGLGQGTNVVTYDYDKEIWFLVRYPGYPQRYAAISDDGEPTSYVFKPEEYDAVVYHKDFGDLRLNTNRKKDHVRYRIAFADLLLNENNLFHPKLQMVNLNPLLGDCAALFRCDDMPGLAEITLVEVRYASLLRPGIQTTLKSEKDCDLLMYHSIDNVKSSSLFPDDDTHSITYAKFRYRRRDTTRTDVLAVHAGNTLTYERDGDSSVLEDWLRRRRFITYSLPALNHADHTAQIA